MGPAAQGHLMSGWKAKSSSRCGHAPSERAGERVAPAAPLITGVCQDMGADSAFAHKLGALQTVCGRTLASAN